MHATVTRMVLRMLFVNGFSGLPKEYSLVATVLRAQPRRCIVSMGQRGGYGSPRTMHKVTCSDCGKETEVPFQPTEGRPVYCRDCYQKHRRY
jgi:CxxC-x17-CxxC domain-containing protein